MPNTVLLAYQIVHGNRAGSEVLLSGRLAADIGDVYQEQHTVLAAEGSPGDTYTLVVDPENSFTYVCAYGPVEVTIETLDGVTPQSMTIPLDNTFAATDAPITGLTVVCKSTGQVKLEILHG